MTAVLEAAPKFPVYPNYRSVDSWLTQVPMHWGLHPLKRLAGINPRPVLPLPDEISFVPMEAVGERGELDTSRRRLSEEVSSGYTAFQDGDVILAKVTPCFENGKGAVAQGLINGVGFGSTEFHVVRPGPELQARYFDYLTRVPTVRALGKSHMSGTGGLQRVPGSFLDTLLVPCPPATEQALIIDFLDRETGRLDALRSKQKQMLELIADKRQAVISEAVTRGLTPNVALKSSGVQWVGDIPAHWTVTRLKKLAQVRTGVTKGRDLKGAATVQVPYLRVANVQDGYLNLGEISTIEITESELDRFRLLPGDVLMNEGGDNDKLGRGAVWHGQIDPCVHQNHVFSVRPHGIEPEWLALVNTSSYAKHYFQLNANQSTNLASIATSALKELPVVLPPRQEREAILRHVSRELARLDTLSTKIRRQLDLVREHRAALITAAVTGQIDVRAAREETA